MDIGFSSMVGGEFGAPSKSLDDILNSVAEKSNGTITKRLQGNFSSVFNAQFETNRREFVQQLYKRFRSHCESGEELHRVKEIPNFIFEKWVFTRMHYQELANSQSSSKAKGKSTDPILPSGEYDSVQDKEFIHDLQAALQIDKAKSMSILSDLLGYSNQLIHRLHTTFNDQAVKLKVKRKREFVVLARGKISSMKLKTMHYEKLKQRFMQFAKDSELEESQFEECLYVLLERYMALPGSGFQAACLEPVFKLLSDRFQVDMECFASPINVSCPTFCSAFADIDQVFGSSGNFFDFNPKTGSFQANPPFVPAIVSSMSQHMEMLLNESQDALSFVIILPDWDRPIRSPFERKAIRSLLNSKYCKKNIMLLQEQHGFYEGAQHRRQELYKISTCQSVVLFLQNDTGAAKWPVTDEFIKDLKQSFRPPEKTSERSVKPRK